MAIGSVQNFAPNVRAYQPQFKGDKNETEVNDIDRGKFIERQITTEGSTGKKWGVGIASFFMAGLGQFINGDVAKGVGFLLAALASEVGMVGGFLKGNKMLCNGCSILNLGIAIGAAVDAVKNAKTKTVQIIDKSEVKANVKE